MGIKEFCIIGKTNSDGQSHLLIYHFLDTAAVVKILWTKIIPDYTKYFFKEYLLSLSNQKYSEEKILLFISSLHDLGKISVDFQDMIINHNEQINPSLVKDLKILIDSSKEKYNLSKRYHHSALTYQTVMEINENSNNFLNIENLNYKEIGLILSSHHGYYHNLEILKKIKKFRNKHLGDNRWKVIRNTHVEKLKQILIDENGEINSHNVAKDDLKQNLNYSNKNFITSAIWLSAFICIADWIASNEDFFPYNETLPDDDDLKKYWSKSIQNAQKAINQLNWKINETKVEDLSFKNLFSFSPRPLQAIIEKIDIKQPECYIIEAPTGEGKTEAAMYLMAKNSRLGLNGAYFALPTQATSNQMFSRVKEFLSKCYLTPGKQFSMMLLHGHANLSKKFEEIKDFNPSKIYDESIENNISNSAIPTISDWFTYRKRGLLSPYGVGTIDQGLLAILQTKHFFVRLFGLSGKTIILDEVHAYDSYMTELIERFLTWVASLGSSVIILSATLPKFKKEALLSAFIKGKKQTFSESSKSITRDKSFSSLKYPRISYTNNKKIKGFDFNTSQAGFKNVKISWLFLNANISHDKFDYIKSRIICSNINNFLHEKVKNYGSIAIICNRVDESQKIYEEIKNFEALGFRVILFHSKFQHKIRARKEKEILELVSKNKNESLDRSSQKLIVIATQVIEQSLDIDFDFMISSLAPIDLILQRIGRLHRHINIKRPENFSNPKFVIMVEFEDISNKTLLIPDFKKYSFIYHQHILLRTWLSLINHQSIEIPNMVEDLIEYVYSEDSKIPEKWSNVKELNLIWINTWNSLIKLKEETKYKAKVREIRIPDNSVPFYKLCENQYEENNPEVNNYLRASTRLVRPNVNVIFLTKKEKTFYLEKIKQFYKTRKLNKKFSIPKWFVKWLLERAISITNYSIVKILKSQDIPIEWKNNSYLRYMKLIILDENNRKQVNEDFSLCLDKNLGLKILKTN